MQKGFDTSSNKQSVFFRWEGYTGITCLSVGLSVHMSCNHNSSRWIYTDETLHSCSNYHLRMYMKEDNPCIYYFKGDNLYNVVMDGGVTFLCYHLIVLVSFGIWYKFTGSAMTNLLPRHL